MRLNQNGKLYTLVYGKPCAVHIDPIEKKPMYHMLPRSTSFSIATAGCCMHCKYCQNWEISQAFPEDTPNYDLLPENLVKVAGEKGCSSIAYTYTEPTIFYEYMIDSCRLARARNIKNVYVTCGAVNPEPLAELTPVMDGANVDLKAFTNEFYIKVVGGTKEPVMHSIKYLYENGVITEVTNLVVPTLNDDFGMIREMCEWLAGEVSRDVPLHFSRFHPTYKLRHLPPTPYLTLTKAHKIAKDAGLKYVYVGNVLEREYQNTYCPGCGKIVIARAGYRVLYVDVTADGHCEHCGEKIYGMFKKQ